MPAEFLGLPSHPLVVHAPIVLVPLAAVLTIIYALVPPLRRHLGWAVMGLSVAAPLSVYAARLAGDRLAAELGGMTPHITNHARHSEVLIWLLLVLVPITWLFGALERGRRKARQRDQQSTVPFSVEEGGDAEPAPRPSSQADPAGRGRRVIMIVLALLMLGLSAVSTVYLYRAGESGARMVWDTSSP